VPLGSEEVTIASGAGLTVRLSCFVAVSEGLPESATWTVKVDVPVAVGVPEITPPLRVKPLGSAPEPEAKLHVRAPAPPLACKVTEYGAPTVPAVRGDAVVTVGGGVTVMVTDADFVASATEVAVTVTVRFAVTGVGAL
jgi:hypothetical protein